MKTDSDWQLADSLDLIDTCCLSGLDGCGLKKIIFLIASSLKTGLDFSGT